MRIVFTETVTTREATPQTFNRGQVYDLPAGSAARWKLRRVAINAPPVPPPDGAGGVPVSEVGSAPVSEAGSDAAGAQPGQGDSPAGAPAASAGDAQLAEQGKGKGK